MNNFSQAFLSGFEHVKSDNETILWAGKPIFIPYAATGIIAGISTLLFAIIWCIFTQDAKFENGGFVSTHFTLFGLLPVVFFAWNFLKRLLSYGNTGYVFTDKRVMMRSGVIGTDFKSIDYDKISDIEVTVNFVEKAFNVGTIRFFSGRTQTNEGVTTKLYDQWEAIKNPYEVFKQVRKVSVDIKTDFHFPNSLRPAMNPGYSTEYKPLS